MTLQKDFATFRRVRMYRWPMVYFIELYAVYPSTDCCVIIGLKIFHDVRSCEEFYECCDKFLCVLINDVLFFFFSTGLCVPVE